MSLWFYPKGTLIDGPWATAVTSQLPGWEHTGLLIGDSSSVTYELPAGLTEHMVIALTGTTTVTWDGARLDSLPAHIALTRTDFFASAPDVLYLGSNTSARITTTGSFAVASAFSNQDLPTQFLSAGEVPVELRGAGTATRQVHNFGVPGVLAAQNLIVCEVITPAGNWSSYPPHKHDEQVPGHESELEEIYYFDTRPRRDWAAPVPGHEDAGQEGTGLFHSYPSDARAIDIAQIVRSGDVALVPYGFHGPAVASPEHDLYYLNVMAGPGPERTWLITDDPAYAGVRPTWTVLDTDPRLPLSGR